VVEAYGLGCVLASEDPRGIAVAINHVLEDDERHDTIRRNVLGAARYSTGITSRGNCWRSMSAFGSDE